MVCVRVQTNNAGLDPGGGGRGGGGATQKINLKTELNS